VPTNQQSMATSLAARPNSVSKKVYFLTIAVVAVIGFAVGTRGSQILGAVAPVLGFKVATGTIDLSEVQKTYAQLQANYEGKLDTQALINGASRGLVAAAGDQYTVFMDSKEAAAFNNDLSGSIGGGVGAEIGLRDNTPTIIRVLPGNPAEKAGLLAGDAIVAINDQSTTGWTTEKTASTIRGDVGTTVKINIVRAGEAKTFTVTRASVSDPSVRSEVRGDTGIITISRFDSQTGELAHQAAQSLVQQHVKNVVLDLRGNGGGYLTAAQDVAGLWLSNKVVVTERVNGKITDTITSTDNPLLAGLPTIVLVDGNSASASEIVAGALQDYKAATLVGEKTFGKGTVQKVLNLDNGALLKVTVAHWYTPNGINISKQGIQPNTTVAISPADVNAGKDPQLDAALAQLNK
jgi:carboxyl-terminal processing protease